jgi:hypothetical protein
MYLSLAHSVTGSPLFADTMALDRVVDYLDAT